MLEKEKKTQKNIAVHAENLNLWYGDFQALSNINLDIELGKITAMIGPSGCGKSTFLRTVNRINERLAYVRINGSLEVQGNNIFDKTVELAQLRKKIGMVFQRPNPLPISIRKNVLFSQKIHQEKKARREDHEEILEKALRQVLLWDAVKDRLDTNALSLSLEEQQKLCIARLLPTKPSLLLMDEPCSALDPKGTEAIETLIKNLQNDFTVLIVTHNMSQAKRVSDSCIFMLLGKVLEHSPTEEMFTKPKLQQTEDYIEGRYG